jgi:hypothetical protein
MKDSLLAKFGCSVKVCVFGVIFDNDNTLTQHWEHVSTRKS